MNSNNINQFQTIATLFEQQVDKFPDEVAIICRNLSLTYRQLNDRANQLANYILSIADIRADDLIVMLLDRNEYMIISLLAILKVGGAYVPISPNFPNKRIEYILNDACPKLIITNQDYFIMLKNIEHDVPILPVDGQQLKNKSVNFSTNNTGINISNSNLAYVIYTSGTTGQPKGVMIEHFSVVELVNNIKSLHFKDTEKINTYSMTNYVFDIFGLEYGLPLLNGGSVTLGDTAFNELNCVNYSFLQMTPSLLSLKLDNILPTKSCKLFVGGEPLSIHLLKKSLKKFPSTTNFYGPTETTIWSSAKTYIKEASRITIGNALRNEQLLVLQQNLNPTPKGEIGELFIGGVGLARGYLNKDGLTQDKFIKSPFNTHQNLYKTGDLARILVDGEIEYIGRNDFQIKIRGHRIELGEIETILSEIPGVQQSIVIVTTHNANQFLIAYYASREKLDEKLVINYLRSKLPNYMIPQQLIHLTQFPLTMNGKIDRESLPEPTIALYAKYIPPKSDTEVIIADIWEEILRLNKGTVGLEENFFALGGHSIFAIQLISVVNKKFNLKLNIVDIYTNQTLRYFANKVESNDLKYQSIIKFNHSQDISTIPHLFMIHPGAGGCEVYTSLASKMVDIFNCYGVDSYNLYHSTKINTLHELAQYYLNQINLNVFRNNDKEWHLLGWSLGGQIALEMAVILERQGYSNITIYLLDTVLNDSTLLKMRTELDVASLKEYHKNAATIKGYNEEYISLLIENMDVEHRLICQNITKKLGKSKILLFKASLIESTEHTPLPQYISTLQHNNIEYFLKKRQNFYCYSVDQANHNNILLQEDYLYKTIKELVCKSPMLFC